MTDELRFDGRVPVVTGGGRSMGTQGAVVGRTIAIGLRLFLRRHIPRSTG